jgi:hypothetical protein
MLFINFIVEDNTEAVENPLHEAAKRGLNL